MSSELKRILSELEDQKLNQVMKKTMRKMAAQRKAMKHNYLKPLRRNTGLEQQYQLTFSHNRSSFSPGGLTNQLAHNSGSGERVGLHLGSKSPGMKQVVTSPEQRGHPMAAGLVISTDVSSPWKQMQGTSHKKGKQVFGSRHGLISASWSSANFKGVVHGPAEQGHRSTASRKLQDKSSVESLLRGSSQVRKQIKRDIKRNRNQVRSFESQMLNI